MRHLKLTIMISLTIFFTSCQDQPAPQIKQATENEPKQEIEKEPNQVRPTVTKTQTNPIVVIQTSMGTIKAELWADKAPITVDNFVRYVDKGFYDGLIFHRVIPGFMIQGGGFTNDMQLKRSAAPIKNEASADVTNDRGTLAMARTEDIHSATAQFFINLADNAFLNHRSNNPNEFGYCVFGKVIEGQDVVDAIAKVKTTTVRGQENVPIEPVKIKSIRLVPLIRKVGPEMKADGNVNKKQWASAQAIDININTFNETKKYQSPTTVKAVYNDEALFLLFVSQDKNIVAKHTKLNSDVSMDDCVEFFAVPQPSKNNDYFNLEINCVGTMVMGFGTDPKVWKDVVDRKSITPQQAKQVEIYHSIPGPTKEAHENDKQWIIEVKIPFELLKDFTGADRPKSGDFWNVNFYRDGSKVDEVHTSWQSVPKEGGMGFHQPKLFAPLRFE